MTRKIRSLAGLLVFLTLAATGAAARDPAKPEVLPGRYIVEFTDPPVALFDGRRAADGSWLMAPTRVKSGRLEPEADSVKEYRAYLKRESSKALASGAGRLARDLIPRHRFDLLTNGVSLDLTAEEAGALAGVDGIKRIYPVTVQRPSTDSGPVWIGAPQAWGASGTMGEGVVVGVIDSGVNWDHPAFADVGGDGYDHENPRGRQFGLCGNAQVRCNDKLIGVYDFTQEGARLGRDTDGHGTHVASTAVGNVRTSNVVGNTASIQLDVSGVAPHANLITYKVCLADDPATPEDENFCVLDAILAALDQIVVDQVPVVNYSIGGSSSNPWEDADTRAMLAARAAGTLIVTSAGNSGSDPGTITSPANAPWMLAVANSTHNRRFQNVLDSMTGGNAAPPSDLVGVGFTGAFGPAPIVYAGDFGNALCGAGEAELQSSCDAHTGRSNPFAPGTFNGEIVVCDRGTYGRIEKGFNVRAAGAGGYVLANTAAQGESTVSDDHCLPATHLGQRDGDQLRAWLNAGGEGLSARIAGQAVVVDDALGDRVSASSSRGPDAFVPGVIKPEVAAPGSNILAAGLTGNTSSFKSGTSMASPHVAGSAALLLGLRPDLTPSQLHSLLVSSAVNNGMVDSNGTSLADAFDVGAGRVNPEAALRAGLTFDITRREFDLADPDLGGDPGSLNLPTLASSRCVGSCSFVRRVQALDGGDWSARVVSDDGVTGQVTPASFSLAAGESQSLTIELDVTGAAAIGGSVTGSVVLTPAAADVASQRIVFQLTAAAGDLPEVLRLTTASNRGSEQVELAGLVALPQASFDTLALDRANVLNRSLAADNTNSDPYDNVAQGAFFVTRQISEAGSLLYAQTGAESPATDLDLFVGRDLNGNARPDAEEELCRSTSPTAVEVCLTTIDEPGRYWVLLQNWRASETGVIDAVTLTVAAPTPSSERSLVATGPGSVAFQQSFPVRLAWDEGQMAPGELWVGALLPRASDNQLALGTIPVALTRVSDGSNGSAGNPDLLTRAPLLMRPDQPVELTLSPHQGHARLFIDVPASATALTLDLEAPGDIQWELRSQARAFDPPSVVPVDSAAQVVASGSGGGRTVAPVTAGRYYLVPINQSGSHQRMTVSMALERQPPRQLQGADGQAGNGPLPGLWFNPARDGAGFNLNQVDNQLILEWYTYLEDGTPTWYLAQGAYTPGDDFWEAELSQFSWDGASARATVMGAVSLVFESASSGIFNFQLHGRSGSEPYQVIISDLSCSSNGATVARTGLWFVPALPGFGYSILSAGGDQVHVNYLYGPTGLPRWVLGQGSALDETVPLAQFSGFCPSCAAVPVSSQPVGENLLIYDSSVAGSVDTLLQFAPPLSGSWEQAGALSNLTPLPECN